MIGNDVLTVERLSVSYRGRQIVSELTLPPLMSGTVTALVGPNGAGKSTVLKALSQIIPSNGNLRFGTDDLREISSRQRSVLSGFMPQGIPNAAELTVIESIIVVLQASHSSTAAERMALEALERTGITNLALRPLDRLSGGERQLASFAQAIAPSPHILFLDEPSSALDLGHQHQMMRLLRQFASDGKLVIMVLHDLAMAAHWADQIIVLKNGRLHSAGSPESVMTASMMREVYGIAVEVKTIDGRLFVLPQDAAQSQDE